MSSALGTTVPLDSDCLTDLDQGTTLCKTVWSAAGDRHRSELVVGVAVPLHDRDHDSLSRVHIISYHFPPQAASGAIRIAKFAKEWGRMGVSVDVVSGPPHALKFEDEAQLRQLPDSVVRVPVGDPSPWLMARDLRERVSKRPASYLLDRALAAVQWSAIWAPLDQQVCWMPGAFWRAMRLARRSRPDVLLASGPPFSPFLTASLVSRLLGIPLVLDYRDPWMTSPIFRRVGGIRARLNALLERRIVQRAAGVVAAHRFILGQLRSLIRTGVGNGPRFFWVPNGYDPEDFGTEETVTDPFFTIYYAGAFYASRNPTGLLRAVEELLAEGVIDAARFRLRLLGSVEDVDDLCSAGSSLRRVVETPGHVPHRDSIRLLRQHTVSLVIVGPRAGPTSWVPAKLYETLFAGRPLLLLSPEGVPTRLARRAGGSSIAHPEDTTAIKQAIVRLYRAWEAGEPVETPDASRISFFDRNHQARRLLRFLTSVSS